MKLHILDPGLESHAGHHCALNRALRDACGQLGLPLQVYSHIAASKAAVADLSAMPVFSSSPYDDPSPVTPDDLPGIQLRIHAALRELRSLSNELKKQNAIILMHSFRTFHLTALARWFHDVPDHLRPHIVLLHTIECFKGMESNSDIEKSFYTEAFRAFETRSQKATIAAPNKELAREFADLSGIGVKLHPIPYPDPEEYGRCKRKDDGLGRHEFGFLGTARYEKGFHMIPEVLTEVMARRGDVNFRVQLLAGSDPVAKLFQDISDIRQRTQRVSLWHGELSSEPYSKLLLSCTGVVLPYSSFRYRYRASVILFEALAAGIPLIAPADTWIAEAIQTYKAGGCFFNENSPAGIAGAICKLLDEYPSHAQLSEYARQKWRQDHGAKQFVTFLVGEARGW